MQKEKINLKETYEYEDGTCLEYEFWGLIDIDYQSKINEIQNIITNVLQNRSKAPTIVEATTIIKNAFRELQTEHLDVAIWKENDYIETVNYQKETLNMYYYNLEQNEKTVADISVEYHQKKGINFSVKKNGRRERKKDSPYLILNNTKEFFNEKISTLYELQNIKMINLTDTEKAICTIYKLFYKTNPNFSRKKDRILAQSMLAFLTEFCVCIPTGYDRNDFYDFTLVNNRNMVISLELNKILYRLAPLGEITEDISLININEETKTTIEVVGTEILKHMSTKENPVDWFKDLVKINYIKRYCLSSNSTSKDIAMETKCSETEVKSNLRLIKTIHNKIEHE